MSIFTSMFNKAITTACQIEIIFKVPKDSKIWEKSLPDKFCFHFYCETLFYNLFFITKVCESPIVLLMINFSLRDYYDLPYRSFYRDQIAGVDWIFCEPPSKHDSFCFFYSSFVFFCRLLLLTLPSKQKVKAEKPCV